MKGNDLYLYLKVGSGNEFVGKAAFKYLTADAPNGVKIRMEFSPNTNFFTAGRSVRWAWLTGEVWNQRVPPRSFGRLAIEPEQRPALNGQPSEFDWSWTLRREDLEGIEQADPDAAKNPRQFKVKALGIIQIPEGTFTVGGEGNFEVALSEWREYLEQLNYGVPPSVAALSTAGAALHPSWSEAERRLKSARDYLRSGDDYVALTACLGEFEKLVPKPYVKDSWLPAVAAFPEQKQDGVAGVFAAHCTYLNKVGYHKDRKDRSATGDLIEMPLNHWEADIAVGASQILLAFVLRLTS